MKQGQTTFYFRNQPPVTPNGTSVSMTSCRGYTGYECPVLLPNRLGVLEPRCPSCFQKHLELVRQRQP
jgi:hypothetical protein